MRQDYLGDGVYVTLNRDETYPLILTTGHHEIDKADNVVYIERRMAERLMIMIGRDVLTAPMPKEVE